jgi:thioredoxin-dependent peroxiredoxin
MEFIRHLEHHSCHMKSLIQYLTVVFVATALSVSAGDKIPGVGDKAPSFTAKDVSGKDVSLDSLNKDGNVVMIMLRGWPGYQCPICSRQVGAVIAEAKKLKALNAKLLMIYPGPRKDLGEHAEEFVGRVRGDWPSGFTLVTDPDYKITNLYNLRWDARRETAYPSTFVIDMSGTIRFSKISKSHGGRTKSSDVIKALEGLK